MRPIQIASTAALAFALATSASAGHKSKKPKLEHDQLVTNHVIFGDGNTNGQFTTDRLSSWTMRFGEAAVAMNTTTRGWKPVMSW